MPTYTQHIKQPTSREETPKRALVFGPPGTGKTLFSMSWPSPFFIETDRGLETLHSRGIFPPALTYGVKDVLAGVHIYDELMDFLQDIGSGRSGWGKDGEWKEIKTLCIDGLSTLAEVLLWDYMYNERGKKRPDQGKPEFDDYNAVRNRLDTLVRLAVDLKLNLVATAGAKSEEDDITAQKNALLPDILGSYRNKAGHAFDTVIFMAKEETGRAGVKYIGYTNTFKGVSKARTEGVPMAVENPTFQSIFFPDTQPAQPAGAAARIERGRL